MPDSPLTSSLAALSRFFVGDGTLEQTLARVADLTREAVPPAEVVGLTLIVEGRARTPIFTDPMAPALDRAQYDAGDGPCMAAFEERRMTSIESTREPGRWTEFRRVAADHGILSTLSFPLVVQEAPVGALNLYARRERAFGEGDAEIGSLFAAQAAIVLANSLAYWDAHDLSARLSEAMEHRAVIEQAKGILMATHRCPPDDAFQLLVKASQHENVKLRRIAQRIVDTTTSRAP
jgi:GAF domain-containing protein